MASDRFIRSGYRNSLLLLQIPVCAGAGFFIAGHHWFAAFALVIAGLAISGILMAIYDTPNKAIALFFDSLRNDDTTLNFETPGGNTSLARLYESMNNLNRHFQDIRLRNEYNESYYRTLIEHGSTGLVVLTGDNSVELINRAACNYAGISPDSTNPNLIKVKHPSFYDAICTLKPGESAMYKHLVSNNLQLLSFRATGIMRKNEKLKLVSVQDIRSELETKELESYRKLMSVLTHEIMNLMSPITSVSKELYMHFTRDDKSRKLSMMSDADIETAVSGLRLISEQTNGMLNFVTSYRKISKIPQPEFAEFDTEDWIAQLKIAFIEKMRENSIEFYIAADRAVRTIIADRKLLNQVMINIVNNAIEALQEITEHRLVDIRISAKEQGRILIAVTNNGPGIPPELIEKIFVPFFTTKESGSGIGLSISQEIMKLHNGSVSVVSLKDGKTSFMIEF